MLWLVCTLHVLEAFHTVVCVSEPGCTNDPDIRLLGHPDIRIDKTNIHCSPSVNISIAALNCLLLYTTILAYCILPLACCIHVQIY